MNISRVSAIRIIQILIKKEERWKKICKYFLNMADCLRKKHLKN